VPDQIANVAHWAVLATKRRWLREHPEALAAPRRKPSPALGHFAFNMQALKRIGQPSDVADVIAFVASGAARWITGATISVDGGSKL
jgi:NAD(P)-dependent dehydrogenase (short-subunit alcohol dehydrogenase family)